MQIGSRSRKVAGLFAGLALCISSTGAIAASPQPRAAVSPFVALSALGSGVSAAALCGSSTVAGAAAVTQGAAQGCVLPVVDQAVAPPPVASAEPLVGIEPVAPMGGAGISPLLLALAGIAAAVGLYYLVFRGRDNFHIVFPESPS